MVRKHSSVARNIGNGKGNNARLKQRVALAGNPRREGKEAPAFEIKPPLGRIKQSPSRKVIVAPGPFAHYPSTAPAGSPHIHLS